MKKIIFYIKNVFYIFLVLIFKPLAFVIHLFLKEKIYIFIERGFDAQDNAWHMYNYYKDKPGKHYFIISKNSPDLKNVEKKDVIYYKSLKHFFMINVADCIISTHAYTFFPGEFMSSKKSKFHFRAKIIFLQHGVTANYQDILTYPKFKCDLFICGAKPEYEYILEKFNHPHNVVQYTGFARYDVLHNINTENILLIMPTWRLWISSKEQFIQSQYYKEYSKLLENEQLLSVCRREGLKIYFYMHYEFQKYSDLFIENDVVKICTKQNYNVQDLLKKSKILITDYSSVFFDFAYMKKPIIYYHFDYEKFYNEHYSKGYFDYSNHGFGPICDNESDLLSNILESIYLGVKQKYINRIDSFFHLFDENNKLRIYECIERCVKH